MLNLEDFQDEYEEAISQAAEFRRRARTGTPPDRWASARQLHLVAKGIEGLLKLTALQTRTHEALRDVAKP